MPTTRPLPVKKVDHLIGEGRLTVDHTCVLGRVRALYLEPGTCILSQTILC